MASTKRGGKSPKKFTRRAPVMTWEVLFTLLVEGLGITTTTATFDRLRALALLEERRGAGRPRDHLKHFVVTAGWIERIEAGGLLRVTDLGLAIVRAYRAEHPAAAPPPAAVEEAASALPGAGCTN